MAIEFTCPNCDHLLRTAEEKSGLSAKCPACGEAIWVPYPHETGRTAKRVDETDAAELEELGDADSPPPQVSEDAAAPSPPPPPPAEPPAIEEEDLFEPPVIEEEDEVSSPPPKRRVAATAEVNCPSCYAANAPAATHCRFCGESLEGVEPVAPPSWTPPVPEVGEAMSTTWRIYQDRLGLLIGATLLLHLLVAVMLVAMYVGIIGIMFGAGAAGGDEIAVVGMLLMMLVAMVVAVLVTAPMMIGVARLNLQVARGLPSGIGDLFYAFGEGRRLLPVMFLVAPVIVILQAFTGGIGMMFFWPFVFCYVDRPRPLGETFSSFFEVLGKQIGFIVLIGLIVWAINAVVAILIYPCCIGIVVTLFTQPFVSLLQAVGYLRIAEQKTTVD